ADAVCLREMEVRRVEGQAVEELPVVPVALWFDVETRGRARGVGVLTADHGERAGVTVECDDETHDDERQREHHCDRRRDPEAIGSGGQPGHTNRMSSVSSPSTSRA